MASQTPVSRLTFAERLNFLVTNRIPRRSATLLMGRLSKVRNRVIKHLLMFTWRLFADDLRLFEAKKQHFDSLHDCFIRELKDGARPIDPRSDVLVSPCDAVIGEFGELNGVEAIQAKGFPYTITDLLGDESLAERYAGGCFLTLRLKSSMYHRFHSPADARIDGVRYISGDTWNVNPVALKVVERLFCKNERVSMELQLKEFDGCIAMVAVAAVLVASVRLNGLDSALNLNYRGPNEIPLLRDVSRGDELGYFEHGSTIVMLYPDTFSICPDLATGDLVRMGRPLLRAGDWNESTPNLFVTQA